MRVLVVCHDAGGAAVIAAWVRRHPAYAIVAVLDGPAEHILPATIAREDPFPDPGGFDLVLCGSSATSDLERLAVAAAREAGVRCVVWLEHWTSYPERFGAVLPDEVWVGDEHAERLARELFASGRAPVIRRRDNPYLVDTAQRVREATRPHSGLHVLFVSQPVAATAERVTGNPQGFGYDEHDAFAACVDVFSREPSGRVTLRVRPHPTQPPDVHLAELAWAPLRVDMSAGGLEDDLAWADVVVGCDTMAMVLALYAGRRVLCAIPPGGRPISIPIGGIEPLEREDRTL